MSEFRELEFEFRENLRSECNAAVYVHIQARKMEITYRFVRGEYCEVGPTST